MTPKALHSWRWILGIAVAAFAGALLWLGPQATYRLWGLQPKAPFHADARGITSAIQSERDGHDPRVENPNDPWGRSYNYPRLWLRLGDLGLGPSHTAAFATVMTLLFLAGVLIFPPPDTRALAGFLILAVVFSPAVMLGVEAGNTDLLMFFLVALAVAAIASTKWWARILGEAALLAGMALKIYPILGGAAIWGWQGRWRSAGLGVLMAAASAFVVLQWEEIGAIQKATPTSGVSSYGRDVLWMRLQELSPAAGAIARPMSWLFTAGAFLLAFLGARGWPAPAFPNGKLHPRSIASFQAGTAIYCGTFLLGNNWDYRLMFVALTIPLLVRLVLSRDTRTSLAAGLALVSVLISCWHLSIWQLARHMPHGSPASVALDEACNWLLFLTLMFLSGHSLRWQSSDTQPATTEIQKDDSR